MTGVALKRKVEDEKEETEKQNQDAGRVTIWNIIKALEHGQSLVDFVADNNLFHLKAESQNINNSCSKE